MSNITLTPPTSSCPAIDNHTLTSASQQLSSGIDTYISDTHNNNVSVTAPTPAESPHRRYSLRHLIAHCCLWLGRPVNKGLGPSHRIQSYRTPVHHPPPKAWTRQSSLAKSTRTLQLMPPHRPSSTRRSEYTAHCTAQIMFCPFLHTRRKQPC